MTLINWSSDLSVGVGEVDRQHKVLIQMINDLNEAMSQRKGKEAAGKVIDGLVNYTVEHFAFEEKIFARTNYPLRGAHVAEHVNFVKKVSDFRDSYSRGTLGLSIDVMAFLSAWLKSHINGTDKKYTAHMNANGIN